MTKLERSAAPLSEDDIADFERDQRVKLPPQYRAFLLGHNGGAPKPNHFKNAGTVKQFFCIDNAPFVPHALSSADSYSRETPDVLTIGLTIARKRLRIGVKGKSTGKVFLFDKDDVATLVADSFDDLQERTRPEIVGSAPPLSGDDIDAFEKSAQVILPKSYRAFLSDTNGGQVVRSSTIRGGEYPWTWSDGLDFFHCIAAPRKGPRDLAEEIGIYRDRIPTDTIPIACDPFGNLILIATVGKNMGKIYFWDHEEEVDNRQPSYANVALVAESFNAFWKSAHAQGG